MKVLVTGGAGYIGSKLIRELPSQADKIVILDNLASKRYASLFDLPKNRNYEFLLEDVRSVNWQEILNGIDVVIHLAALASPEESVHIQEEVESVNVEGAKKVADACLATGCKLIFVSTTSVYGSTKPRIDETAALSPQSPYAASKIAAENYIRGLAGLKFTIFRFGTIFGPSVGMRFEPVVNKFLWQAVLGKPLSVWETAFKQKRPYLDLSDAVEAINYILEKDIFTGETYNVVTGNYTVEQIVNAIKKYLPKTNIELVDSAIMNTLSYEIVDDKIRALGFVPRGDLERGISDTINLLKGIVNED